MLSYLPSFPPYHTVWERGMGREVAQLAPQHLQKVSCVTITTFTWLVFLLMVCEVQHNITYEMYKVLAPTHQRFNENDDICLFLFLHIYFLVWATPYETTRCMRVYSTEKVGCPSHYYTILLFLRPLNRYINCPDFTFPFPPSILLTISKM